jgi:hypothetical protein
MSGTAGARLGLAAAGVPTGTFLRSDLDLRQVWPSFLVWLAVSVCTLGLGWIVVSGHFFKMLINSTALVDENGRVLGHLVCDYDVESDVGRIVRWVLLSIVTLGVGLLFYSFRAAKLSLSATKVEWV